MMKQLKPKEWHERFLANADREKILQYLKDDQEHDITKIAVGLARQSTLFADFVKLWMMRVSDLDARLSSDHYMERIYVGRRTLHKDLRKDDSP
jgi:hypothetical protein